MIGPIPGTVMILRQLLSLFAKGLADLASDWRQLGLTGEGDKQPGSFCYGQRAGRSAEALLAAITGYRTRAAATGRSIERVIAVYEAGCSGFWLARWLMRHGVEVYVIQPSSVPVDRRMRRAKSDGIDSELLLRTLLAWLRGEPRVCSMVPVPDEADEDARRCVRERTEPISERIGLTNRIGAVLATLGVSDYNPLLRNRCRRLAELRTGCAFQRS